MVTTMLGAEEEVIGESPIRILIVEDHEMVAEALHSSLRGEPRFDVVGIAADAADAQRLAGMHRPHVVVSDFQLGSEQSPAWFERFRTASPGCAILVLTGWATERSMLAALDAGASGFLSKAQPMEALVDGVRRLADGEMVVAPEFLGVLAKRSAPGHRDRGRLSRRELEILDRLVGGATTATMASELALSEHTVRNHIAKVMLRLGVHSRVEAVSEAVRRGIVSPPAPH